jgi:hypothetical protein
VSPLWRDEVRIFVAPKRIVLVRMKRGMRPVVIAERSIIVDTRETHRWESALDTLDVCFRDPLWHGANARLIIADHWARYSTVPWTDAISGETERIAHARLCMANTFGDLVSQWTVTVSESAPGSLQVACGIPNGLLSQIRLLSESVGLRIQSIQPYLVASFNSWREKMPSEGAWFVTLDEGSLAAAHFTNTQWDCVRSVRIGDDWETELKRLQTFGRLARTSDAPSRVFVDAPRWLRDKAPSRERDFEWLDDGVQRPESDGFALLQRIYA